MQTTVTDVRIRSVRPLISPAILEDELPLSEAQASRIQDFRRQVADIVMGKDDRLLVLVGPCSVHDTQAALEYANRLLPLAEELRVMLTDHVGRHGFFLLHMARNCLASRPPLSFFKNFIVDKDGDHKNTFSLKRRGLVFFVDFARLMALKCGISETNTLDRLRILQEGQFLPLGLCSEIIEAYEFLMHLRLVHQLRRLEAGGQPNNHINPMDLSDLERQTLKEAFAVITRMQDSIRRDFQIKDL